MSEQYDQTVADYQWVKENIRYFLSPWGDTSYTLATRRGHCGAKAELLSQLLRSRGINTRYVEGRFPLNTPATIGLFSKHFWVEAEIDGDWVAFDPTPDSGITHFTGDTQPNSHLGNYAMEVVWDEIPISYKTAYNNPLMGPVRLFFNTKIYLERKTRGS